MGEEALPSGRRSAIEARGTDAGERAAANARRRTALRRSPAGPRRVARGGAGRRQAGRANGHCKA
eukprot:11199012-Lingulodinium_polyedra.AAC.1